MKLTVLVVTVLVLAGSDAAMAEKIVNAKPADKKERPLAAMEAVPVHLRETEKFSITIGFDTALIGPIFEAPHDYEVFYERSHKDYADLRKAKILNDYDLVPIVQ